MRKLNHNSKHIPQNPMSGYTLVELLAVTSIVVIVSGLIIGVLYSTLRGGSKTRITNDVAQNGNYAISVISNTALLAEAVTEIGGTPVSDCTTLTQGSSIQLKNPDGSFVTFSCDVSTESIASSSAGTTTYLIDNSSVKVDPSTCSFACYQSTGNPYDQPIINATFTVSERSGGSFVENTASSPFQTSVTMRNYNP